LIYIQIIDPSYSIITKIEREEVLKLLERIGRTSYKTANKITENSCYEFVKNIIKRGHESVLEHYSFSVRFICSRGIADEIRTHRIASHIMESTRHCNYSNELNFILSSEMKSCNYAVSCLYEIERCYIELLKSTKPEIARDILPLCLKTELVTTANLREWRYFLNIRTKKDVHSDLRKLTIPLLEELQSILPEIFEDIYGEI
jgi:thymidylate synthase (FAD)